ncbi:lysophospholipid acyltransferase family protein [Alteromonas sp. ASW11-36]|uniref:L-ornithine N(alpha)-acyltransferase n=1 Tax=Alteromonas arenosi TaxID=3055817 RepID=A0ABT7SU99_9ALTE|nr:lysophospholipid acyltransferase family protein [Alteromonas sp. ASW11-36]MDM7859730.1 lysophospholipid acyltransferase family protein [Alteromonas sp. ASW11-36]
MFNVNTVLQEQYPALKRHPLLFKSSEFVLKHLLHEREFTEFERLYPHLHDIDFVEQVLEYFSISCSARDVERENIPSSGKLLIIANHPIGSLDALALIKLVSEVRSDLKVVANQMLMAIKPLNGMLLPVNNMQGGTPKQHLLNIQQHLQDEGAVLIFPAGEVSRLRPQGVRDTHWHSGFLRIAKASQAPILPVFIDAKNSPLFYGASMLYKPLATALLVKEMFKQKRKHIPMRIGEVIPHSSYANIQLPLPDLAKLFKTHLYRVASGKRLPLATQRPIAAPEDRKVLKSAILSQCERLGETTDGKQIFLYQHMGSSPIMREIGRLRELAFRAVGEGSLRRRDIDPFDSHYYHLLLWDENDLEIVGAYRLGDAAVLSRPDHPTGLYSATLFDYAPNCAEMLAQGLELGRSFVQPRYWGKRSLDYLWFGIGAFLARYPRYRFMFGPVSISNAFPAAAVKLLVDFYANSYPQLATLPSLTVHGKMPYPISREHDSAFANTDSQEGFKRLKHLLANMGVNVPTLLKQYAELTEANGVCFLDFNIDPEFNDCIDGFVVADMHMLKQKKYNRYIQPHLDNSLAS